MTEEEYEEQENTSENVIPLNKFPKEFLSNPYLYINSYYESIYPFMGGKVFEYLSLVPTGLIIPKIPRDGRMIKQKLSLFLLSSPGSGKSSISTEFQRITYNPISTLNITPARLAYEIRKRDKTTIIIPDVAISLLNEELIKILESTIGEDEIISRNTMSGRKKEESMSEHKEVVAFLSGTPENITNNRLRDGLLQRCAVLVVFHSSKEHEKIIDIVNDSMGNHKTDVKNDLVKSYYFHLREIQEGRSKILKPITGYIIPDQIKEELKNFIKPLVREAFMKFGVNAIRETEQAYRYMVNHAFLNIFKREVINNEIKITTEDLKVAKYLIKGEIETKYKIYSCMNMMDLFNLRTMNDLRKWAYTRKVKNNETISQEAMFIMGGLVKK